MWYSKAGTVVGPASYPPILYSLGNLCSHLVVFSWKHISYSIRHLKKRNIFIEKRWGWLFQVLQWTRLFYLLSIAIKEDCPIETRNNNRTSKKAVNEWLLFSNFHNFSCKGNKKPADSSRAPSSLGMRARNSWGSPISQPGCACIIFITEHMHSEVSGSQPPRWVVESGVGSFAIADFETPRPASSCGTSPRSKHQAF